MTKFLKQAAGQLTEEAAATDGGAPNAGKIPELDGNGRLHINMMPSGIGADTASIVASEALAAGDEVNIFNDGGTPKMRKADASTSGKEAHGFVLAAVSADVAGTVYFEGLNDQVSGMVAGPVYLSAAAPGTVTATPPSGSGNIVQRLGVALSATSINFEAGQPIVLA